MAVTWLLAGLLAAVAVAWVVWWLLIETEGAYLGQRAVTWLYDRFATRYDSIKAYNPTHEYLYVSSPIMNAARPHTNMLMLDIATGTARLPLAMLAHGKFNGHILAVDISRKMLQQAAYKLADDMAHVDLLHSPANCLPFPDETFDVVTFLEALEFVDDPEAALREAIRVLRPGGLLLTTLRISIKTMPGKVWSQEKMQHTLESLNVRRVYFEPWQEEYTKAWARKEGPSTHIGAKPLESVLRCSNCGEVAYSYHVPHFVCGNCDYRIAVGEDGVLEVKKAQVRNC